MNQLSMHDSAKAMSDLDARFQKESGLSDRRDYSIFYSRLIPSRVMVIGIKPGGQRDGTHQLASQTFYEDNAHEYVDMNYRIAAVMRPSLMRALGATHEDQLRGVPKTNCFFHRAVGTDDFSTAELRANAALCAPFLAEMIAIVNPEVLILEGAGARDLILRHQCQNVREDVEQRIVGPRRGTINTFFRRETAWLKPLGRDVTLLTLGHPSQFGHLPTWQDAVEALRSNLGPAFLSASVLATPVRPAASKPPAANSPKDDEPNRLGEAIVGKTTPLHGTVRERSFTAALRPPATFGYRPIHDFWQELLKTGSIGVEEFYQHLISIGWRRPSGKPLTAKIVRTDLVSMVKHGFAVASGDR